jgi:hypothetical protein
LHIFLLLYKKVETIVTVYIIMIVRTRKGEQTMELIFEQCDHNKQEEPCEECAPNKENEDTMDLYEYDYNKRIWF